MPKIINSIEDCLSYLKKISQDSHYINNIMDKLDEISKYLWSNLNEHKQFTVWPYERSDEIGFCLLRENELTQKKAKNPFFVIKPKGGTDFYNGNDFEPISKNDFLALSPESFDELFIGAANKRALSSRV